MTFFTSFLYKFINTSPHIKYISIKSLPYIYYIFKKCYYIYDYTDQFNKHIITRFYGPTQPNTQISFQSYINISHIHIYTYQFTFGSNTPTNYTFKYILKNIKPHDNTGQADDTHTHLLLNKLISLTNQSLLHKENNKTKILYTGFINENDDLLCDITEELRLFKFYFDHISEHEPLLSPHHFTWNDLKLLIEHKYNRYINPLDVYVHTIKNDNDLTETQILLSSILQQTISF